ncbi:SIMPL domain-containing protein [Halomonas vilamensis]|uniref:SIMPL domain-containing protein n=1 Tax=Vreelandella vilamensis TaxID=531309 RepID=A0ABU1H2S2_9GAMM|nr:SIMPL domain-containing protein [Halomonas vilamensis]MDR5898597.1 SIMPL domain-containing protein [Halomonas vilamensis]
MIPTALTHPLQRLLFGTCLAIFAFACSAQANEAITTQETPRLRVTADAHVDVAPDKATLSARLWEDTPAINQLAEEDQAALSDARQQLEKRAGELIRTLEAHGVAREAITAGSLNISPQQVHNARDNGERETLRRTRIERPVTVELHNVERVSEILDALVAASVNRLEGVEFDLQDRDAATDEALVKALEKARHKANLMATTLDTQLSRVIRIEETQSPSFQPRMMAMSAERSDAGATQSEYRPGTIRIDAGVNVEWSLKE